MATQKISLKQSFIIALDKLIDHVISRKFIVFLAISVLTVIAFILDKYFETILYVWAGIAGGLIGADVVQRKIETNNGNGILDRIMGNESEEGD